MSESPFLWLNRPVHDPTPVVATDLEGTLTAAATWEGLRDYLQETGRGADFRRFYRAKWWPLIKYRLGIGDPTRFKSNWIRGLLFLFAGDSRKQMDAMGQWVADRILWPSRRVEMQRELDGLARQGQRIVIVSGMFAPILTAVAGRFGYEAIGTPLIYDDDIFSGECGPLNIRRRKAEALSTFPTVTRAYGDTGADVPMLKMAREAIAVHPDERLRQVASTSGWRIFEE